MSKLRIAEIFTSIQGEGIWAGVPSTFVRTSGCNLRCVWCDTKYASWDPEGPVMELGEIVEAVARGGVRDVVITGGEPMLFESTVELCERLASAGHRITIETAGTVFRELKCDLMSISPKLANSTPGVEAGEGWMERHEATRKEIEPLARLIEAYNVQLKFVANPELGDQDVVEILDLLGRLPSVPADRVLLMAEGVDSETQLRRQRMLVPVCLERGWRLSPRLHIDLFGNTKGT